MAQANRRIICSCIRRSQPTIRPVSAQRRVRKGQSTRQREKGRSGRRASGAGCKAEGLRLVASLESRAAKEKKSLQFFFSPTLALKPPHGRNATQFFWSTGRSPHLSSVPRKPRPAQPTPKLFFAHSSGFHSIACYS